MSAKTLTVRFTTAADLLAQAGHVEHDALFVPTPDPLPEAMAEILVHVESGTDKAQLLTRVVQIVPGAGIALAFEDPASAHQSIDPLLETARAAGGKAAGKVESIWGRPAPKTREDEGTLHERIRKMSASEKMQLAAHGDRSARLVLMKDTNKAIHSFVIQNPRVTLDEVRYMAGYPQCNPDVLKTIGQNREWTQNPRVVSALVRNPKTPTPVAVRLLDKLPKSELRAIAKSPSAPRPVSQAAKRKVAG